MSMPETSGVSYAPQPAPIISGESQGSDTPKVMDEAITGAEAYRSEKQIGTPSYADRTASILQNTYFFTPEEARQISAFAEAVKATNPNLCPDVKSGFLDKIKALCAKILEFFGNNSKTVQLHKDGIAVFNRLRETLRMPENKNFCLGFIDRNKSNSDVLMGFSRILGNFDSLINPQLLKECPDVKSFLEQEVLPMTKEEVLAGLRANLEKPSKGSDWKDVFSQDNVICKDIDRGFIFTFHVGNRKIPINLPKVPEGTPKEGLAYQALNESISTLPKDQQDKIREFCKNFSSQGIFTMLHPRVLGAGRIGTQTPNFDVYISEKGIHVAVSSGAEEPINAPYSDGGHGVIIAKITTLICKFEFDYHPEDGHSSNIQLTEYSGQTVSIDLKATRSM